MRRCWSSRPRRRPRRRSTGSRRSSPSSCARPREDPEIARNAPYTTPVRRLDEAAAARNPVLRQPLETSVCSAKQPNSALTRIGQSADTELMSAARPSSAPGRQFRRLSARIAVADEERALAGSVSGVFFLIGAVTADCADRARQRAAGSLPPLGADRERRGRLRGVVLLAAPDRLGSGSCTADPRLDRRWPRIGDRAAVAASGGIRSPAWVYGFFVVVFAAYFFPRPVASATSRRASRRTRSSSIYDGRARTSDRGASAPDRLGVIRRDRRARSSQARRCSPGSASAPSCSRPSRARSAASPRRSSGAIRPSGSTSWWRGRLRRCSAPAPPGSCGSTATRRRR